MKKERYLPIVAIVIIWIMSFSCQERFLHNESCEDYYIEKYPVQRKLKKIGEEDLIKIQEGWIYDDVVNEFGVGYKHMPIMFYPAKCEDKIYYFFSFRLQKNLSHNLKRVYKGCTGGPYDIIVWPPKHKGKTVKQVLRENRKK